MIRCAACGIRLLAAAPLCPAHGAPGPSPSPSPSAAAEPPPMEIPAPDLPPYRVHARIGQGGQGAVFRAERRSDGKTVAIKVARADQPAASERLRAEAQALAAIAAPYVPELHEQGTLEGGAAY